MSSSDSPTLAAPSANFDTLLREAIDNAKTTGPSHYVQKSYEKTPASKLKSRMLDRKAHRTLMVLERKYRRLRNSSDSQSSKQRKPQFNFEDDHSQRQASVSSATSSKGKVYGLSQEMHDAVSLASRGTKRKTEPLPPGLQFGAPHIKPIGSQDFKPDEENQWRRRAASEAASSLRILCTLVIVLICLSAIVLVVYLADMEGSKSPPLSLSSPPQISQSTGEALSFYNVTERSLPVVPTFATPTNSSGETFTLSNRQWDEESLRQLLESLSVSIPAEDSLSTARQAFQWKLHEDKVPALTESRVLHRFALASIYFSLGGESWNDNTGWLTEAHECTWAGLKCGGTGDDDRQLLEAVTYINLSGNNLTGTLPSEFYLLSVLIQVHLNDNNISGPIADNLFGGLGELVALSLSGNDLEGPMPDCFLSMTSLQYLAFSDNSFTGRFPSSLSSSLMDLRLANNALTGELPDVFERLSNLRVLAAGNNFLSGSLPSTVGLIPQLQTLHLHDNMFTGTIPDFVSSEMQFVHLDHNSFTGPIPFFGSDFSLKELRLGRNQLEDVLPIRLGEMTNLAVLHLEENKLVGRIPHQLGYLEGLLSFRIDGNELSGNVPGSVCDLVDSYSLSEFGAKCDYSNLHLSCSCCDDSCQDKL